MESRENLPNNEETVLIELKAILDAKVAEKGYDDIHHKIVAIIDALVISGMTTNQTSTGISSFSEYSINCVTYKFTQL